MTTDAQIGYGSLLEIFDEDLSPPAWKRLAEVTSITPPGISADAQEATHTESTGGFREFIPGLLDGGECSAEMNFIPGGPGAELIIRKMKARKVVQARVIFPDGNPDSSPISASVWSFSAVVTGFEPEAPVEDTMTASVNFKVTGEPQFTPAAGA
jgi:hypothetical protein